MNKSNVALAKSENYNILSEMLFVKEQLRILKSKENNLKSKIISMMDNNKVVLGDYTAFLKVTVSKRIDTKSVKELLENDLEDFLVDVESKKLEIFKGE